ncbi:hypothetical protein [Candidatus Phytoplasma oryzae]|nr:hypothetical protein PIE28_02025 [Candidatus Phytoplasma oryzae]
MNFNFKKNKFLVHFFLFLIIFVFILFKISLKYDKKILALGKKNFFKNIINFSLKDINRISSSNTEEKRSKIKYTISTRDQAVDTTEINEIKKIQEKRENFLFEIFSFKIE